MRRQPKHTQFYAHLHERGLDIELFDDVYVHLIDCGVLLKPLPEEENQYNSLIDYLKEEKVLDENNNILEAGLRDLSTKVILAELKEQYDASPKKDHRQEISHNSW